MEVGTPAKQTTHEQTSLANIVPSINLTSVMLKESKGHGVGRSACVHKIR